MFDYMYNIVEAGCKLARCFAGLARSRGRVTVESARHAHGDLLEPMLPPLVDIGANLTKSVFRKDYSAVLSRAAAADVTTIVVTSN